MSFMDGIKKIIQTDEHATASEIADLKAKLKAAEQEKQALKKQLAANAQEKAKMQAEINLLKQNATNTSDFATKNGSELYYTVKKIIETFKAEISKLPPPKDNTELSLSERYNTLFTIIDKLYIPLIQEFGSEDLLKQAKSISKNIKLDAPEIYVGRILKKTLEGNLDTPVKIYNGLTAKLNGCEKENQEIEHEYSDSFHSALRTAKLVEHIKKIEDIGNIVPQDEESTKRWLETIISLGTWAIDFALSYKNMPGYETGIIATLLGEQEKEFRYRDPSYSGERANKIYELLLDLSKKYGIDISRTQVYAGRTNISHGHKENDFSLYLDTSKGSR